MERERIRNFSIIAHIDHGKSTLADRFLEITGALSKREMEEQVLDSMDLEREKGITIKAHFVRLEYKYKEETYYLNLIDTPGHVDFSYEVSRSLAACEGALLVIDASQGVEAQTIANTYLAIENDLVLIPVINKIDLPNADVDRALTQLESIIGIPAKEAIMVSAKYGTNVEKVLDAIIERIPPPGGKKEGPLRALVFDSWFDNYRGVITLVRVFDGKLEPGMKIKFMQGGGIHEVTELGILTPKYKKINRLNTGEAGLVIASIKNIRDVMIGDTITELNRPASEPLPGFKRMKPMVFAGLYPADGYNYEDLRDALEKLSLNDSSITFEPENSQALGMGFRCGFLGMLHREIIQERLEREFGMRVITTAPSVGYRVYTKDGKVMDIESPAELPPADKMERIEEPYVELFIITPDEYVGSVMKLTRDRRGVQKKMEYISPHRVMMTFEIPLSEIIYDFFNKLKSITRGYASMDYEFIGYKPGDLVKLDILINGEPVESLSFIVEKSKAYEKGRQAVTRLRKLIPRQLFEVAIQASVGKRVIARETVKPLRKDVLAKCYGGDVTRKKKLLEKQKEGKKRMKRIGKVDIPQEAFLSVLKSDED